MITDRLKELREEKGLSQGEIEKRTGLLRCYISRVENGHTIPSVETLEKFARALEVPMYRLFYDGDKPEKPLYLKRAKEQVKNPGDETLEEFRKLLERISPRNRGLLIATATRLAQPQRVKKTR